MQSLWCCQQILTKSVAQVHVYFPEGTLALREGTKMYIDVLPLGVFLVCQSLEVGKEISFHLLLFEKVVSLVDDRLKTTAAYRFGSCRKVEVVLLFRLVLRLGIDVDAKRLMADDFHRALVTIAWIIVKIITCPSPRRQTKDIKKISGACQPKISSQCLKRSKPSSPNFAMLRSAFSTVFSLSRWVFEKNLSA